MTATTAPIDLLNSPLQRAEYMAEVVEVDVSYLSDVSDDTSDFLVLLFRGVDGSGRLYDAMLVRDGIDADEKAAGIIFALSIVTVGRDIDPGIFETLRCKGDPTDGDFIAVGRSRLPAPTEGGFGRLAFEMGKRMGLTEPAVFEVMGA